MLHTGNPSVGCPPTPPRPWHLQLVCKSCWCLSPAAAFAMPAGSRGPGCSAAPRRAGTSRRPGAHLASSTGSRLCHLHRGPAHVHSCDTPASRRVLENILLNFPAAGGQEGRKGRTCARRPLLSERGGGCSPARRSAWKVGDAGGCSEGPSSGRAGVVLSLGLQDSAEKLRVELAQGCQVATGMDRARSGSPGAPRSRGWPGKRATT